IPFGSCCHDSAAAVSAPRMNRASCRPARWRARLGCDSGARRRADGWLTLGGGIGLIKPAAGSGIVLEKAEQQAGHLLARRRVGVRVIGGDEILGFPDEAVALAR